MTRISGQQNIFRMAPKTDNVGAYNLIDPPDIKGLSEDQAKYAQEQYEKAMQKLLDRYDEKLLKQALQIKANIKEYVKSENEKIKQYNKENPKAKKALKHFDENNTLDAEYYIKLAQQMNLQGLTEASLAVNKNKLSGYPDIDSKWAGFSYEEIIEMENNGCEIPQEVLLWAHAQQQSDVTSYIIVSDSSSVDDELSKQDNSVNNLEKRVKQYAIKAETTKEESEKAFEEYKKDAEKANQIKKEKESTFENEMKEISDLTKEWKALKEKSKSNSLTESEQKRFTELGKQINGADGKKMKEVQNTHSDLDNFLASINTLNDKIEENTQLSQDTTDAALELSKLTMNFVSFMLPHESKERFINNSLTNSFQNMHGYEVAETAIDMVRELDQTTETIDSTINNGETAEIVEFSNGYVNLADKTENETKETMGDDFEKEQNPENSQDAEQKVINKDKYSIAKIFSFANSIAATAITIKSLTELKTEKDKTEDNEKKLKTAMKNSEKEIKTLNKETTTLEQKQEQKAQEEEAFLEKLDSINEKQAEPVQKPEEAEEQNEEKANTLTELETLNNSKENLNKGVKKAVTKTLQSDKKNSKLAKLLRANSKDLVKINNNTKEVAEDTQFVGNGTVMKSHITKSIGTMLCDMGAPMILSPFPPTVATGMNLIAAGTALINLSIVEMVTGIAAETTGAIAREVSRDGDETESDAKQTEKGAQALVKEHKSDIKEATELTNEQKESNVTAENAQASGETTSAEGSNETESAEGTETTQSTDETSKPEEEQNNEQIEDTNNQEDDSQTGDQTAQSSKSEGYSVTMGFGFTPAIAAAATTIAATVDVSGNQSDIKDEENVYKANLAKIKNLEKQNEKAQKVAQNAQKRIIQETTQAALQIEEASITLNQASKEGNEEQVVASQMEIQNLSATIDNSTAEGTKASAALDKALQTTTTNISQNENNAKNLKNEVNKFDQKLDSQLDVSQKTLTIGIGTTAIGGVEMAVGFQNIAEGTALLMAPWTTAAGEALIVKGNIELAKGIQDISGGSTATAAATAGLVIHEQAKTSQAETTETVNDGSSQLKNSKQSIQRSQKDNRAGENETQNATQEINSISASVSTNADISDYTSDSDKEDRRLSRFNEESIIESKKKRKKVLAVSASSKG
ncbi:MAG: hypothetical protein NC191_00135 [Muribaculaceae bacterium]|nr:hypothetical protein [Muribaculaceae bacterium]